MHDLSLTLFYKTSIDIESIDRNGDALDKTSEDVLE